MLVLLARPCFVIKWVWLIELLMPIKAQISALFAELIGVSVPPLVLRLVILSVRLHGHTANALSHLFERYAHKIVLTRACNSS